MKKFQKISYSEVVRLSMYLEGERHRETEEGLSAIVHAIFNRCSQGEHIGNILEELAPGRQKISSTAASLDILSLISSVFTGRSHDPTDGSVRFHWHEEMPSWAVKLTPAALIGGRFYYV